jgi:hypothetical protein
MATPGCCILFTLISLHALVLLTVATIVLEFAGGARTGRAWPAVPTRAAHAASTILLAVKQCRHSPRAAAHHGRASVCPDGPAACTRRDRPPAAAAGQFIRASVALGDGGRHDGIQPAIGTQLRGAFMVALAKNIAAPGADGRGRRAGHWACVACRWR